MTWHDHPVEQDHLVNAYTFELAKCWDQVVRERQLRALANIHPDLCRRVAEGLGLAPPEPSEAPIGTSTSAALRQLGRTWPVSGRQVGILVGADLDAKAVESLRTALHAAGVVPLVVGPRGGVIDGVTVQRSYAVVASIELDAVVVAGPLPPAPDAQPSVDAKEGAAAGPVDPRMVKLLGEVWRHAKAVAVVAGAEEVLAASDVPLEGTGVVVGEARTVTGELLGLMAGHRAWERFTPVSA